MLMHAAHMQGADTAPETVIAWRCCKSTLQLGAHCQQSMGTYAAHAARHIDNREGRRKQAHLTHTPDWAWLAAVAASVRPVARAQCYGCVALWATLLQEGMADLDVQRGVQKQPTQVVRTSRTAGASL
jgi:hypothetical protein